MSLELRRIIEQVSRDKGIDKELLISAIKDAVRSAARKKYGPKLEIEVEYRDDTGEIEVFQYKEVVEKVQDPFLEVSLKEGRALVYNYCDLWCERCPLTSRCLNFSISQEDSSDPEAQDIRNKAFWDKLPETCAETLEMLKEGAKESGIDLDTVELTEEDTERFKAKDRTEDNHLLSRAVIEVCRDCG